jgi:hypothetical protein
MAHRVYSHVRFEFDDPAVVASQEVEASNALALEAIKKGPGVDTATCLVDHKHEGAKVISLCGSYYRKLGACTLYHDSALLV